MPLPLSCPDNLTPNPSFNNVAHARASAVAQSIAFPCSIEFNLSLKIFLTLLCALNFSGIVLIALAISNKSFSFTEVSPFRASNDAVVKPFQFPSNQSALLD